MESPEPDTEEIFEREEPPSPPPPKQEFKYRSAASLEKLTTKKLFFSLVFALNSFINAFLSSR